MGVGGPNTLKEFRRSTLSARFICRQTVAKSNRPGSLQRDSLEGRRNGNHADFHGDTPPPVPLPQKKLQTLLRNTWRAFCVG